MLGSLEYVYFLWTCLLIHFFFFFFRLNLACVFSDMLCIRIFYAVAHTQPHISYSLHCSDFHCACLFSFFFSTV